MTSKFYMIKTPMSLDWLSQQLYEISYNNDIQLKVVRDKYGQETQRTVAFLSEDIYTKLLSQPRRDWVIEPFIVPPFLHPDPQKCTYNFYIPFPASWAAEFPSESSNHVVRDEYYHKQIRDKLVPFNVPGGVPLDAYRITTPVISREKSQTQPVAFVVFHDSVPRDILALIRIMLDRGTWNDNRTPFRCFWAFVSNKHRQRPQYKKD